MAAKANQNAHEDTDDRMVDTWAPTAPSKAQNRNRSSRWGKWSHIELERRLQSKIGSSMPPSQDDSFLSPCNLGSFTMARPIFP